MTAPERRDQGPRQPPRPAGASGIERLPDKQIRPGKSGSSVTKGKGRGRHRASEDTRTRSD